MKAALVGADDALLHETRRATGRERGPEAVVESILDFAAELPMYGGSRFGETAAAAGVAVPGHRRRARTASRSTPPTSAGVTYPCAKLLERPAAAFPSPSATTSAPAGSPRGGSAPGGTATASCSCRWAPASRAAIGITAASKRAPTAARARSGTSSSARRPGCGCGQRGCLERRLRFRGGRWPGPPAVRRPGADAADCAKAVESGDPARGAVWHEARRRARRRPGHRAHPARPAHSDHRWRARRGRGNLVRTPAGRRPRTRHVPESCPSSSRRPSGTPPDAWAQGCSPGIFSPRR